MMGGRYKQNQLREELRTWQDRMEKENRNWRRTKEAEEQEMEIKKKEMAKAQVSFFLFNSFDFETNYVFLFF